MRGFKCSARIKIVNFWKHFFFHKFTEILKQIKQTKFVEQKKKYTRIKIMLTLRGVLPNI